MKQFCLVLLIVAAAQAQLSIQGQLSVDGHHGHSGGHGFNWRSVGGNLRNGVNQMQKGIASFGKQVQHQVAAGAKNLRDRVIGAQAQAIEQTQRLVDAGQAQAKKILAQLGAALKQQVAAGLERDSVARAYLSDATAQLNAQLNKVRAAINSNGESLLNQLTSRNIIDAKVAQNLLDAVNQQANADQTKVVDFLNGLNAKAQEMSAEAKAKLAELQANAEAQISEKIDEAAENLANAAEATVAKTVETVAEHLDDVAEQAEQGEEAAASLEASLGDIDLSVQL
ncbi:hypothetical protein HDE_04526 [Halotydeus destructor]|nr:hypothetical protein HDE_04526 [Halotydeus destructor]